MVIRKCIQCGTAFEAQRVTAKFCTGRCRMANHRGIPPKLAEGHQDTISADDVNKHLFEESQGELQFLVKYCPDVLESIQHIGMVYGLVAAKASLNIARGVFGVCKERHKEFFS